MSINSIAELVSAANDGWRDPVAFAAKVITIFGTDDNLHIEQAASILAWESSAELRKRLTAYMYRDAGLKIATDKLLPTAWPDVQTEITDFGTVIMLTLNIPLARLPA